MDTLSERMKGRLGLTSVILALGGVFGVIEGLLAVYRPELFVAGAAFWFGSLATWGWIIFGLGVASIVASATVAGGTATGRWFGVLVASLVILGQLLFAQAYPLWALVMVAISVVAINGLFARSDERAVAAIGATRESGEEGQASRPSEVTGVRSRRAA